MPDPTPAEQERAREIAGPCYWRGRKDRAAITSDECACGPCRATSRIATALEDARIDASVPIHLSRPEHPKAKWCDGAFLLKATTDRDEYTCVPCAIAYQRAQDSKPRTAMELLLAAAENEGVGEVVVPVALLRDALRRADA